jgi:hypothetical protein
LKGKSNQNSPFTPVSSLYVPAEPLKAGLPHSRHNPETADSVRQKGSKSAHFMVFYPDNRKKCPIFYTSNEKGDI